MSNFTDQINSAALRWDEKGMVNNSYTCGYCGAYVSSEKGMPLLEKGKVYPNSKNGVYICTNCHMSSYIYNDIQVPGNRFGASIKDVPELVNKVYEEARSCYAANAFTGAVLLCRKLLMHVAVDLGAKENLRFVEYVNYLNEQHYVSVKSDKWIDQIRKYGNEATHEIQVNSKQDAQMILKFCEMLLKMNYEYPSIIKDQENN